MDRGGVERATVHKSQIVGHEQESNYVCINKQHNSLLRGDPKNYLSQKLMNKNISPYFYLFFDV